MCSQDLKPPSLRQFCYSALATRCGYFALFAVMVLLYRKERKELAKERKEMRPIPACTSIQDSLRLLQL